MWQIVDNNDGSEIENAQQESITPNHISLVSYNTEK